MLRVALLCTVALSVAAQDITGLFPKIDVNGDGNLDREEVLTFLKSGHILTTGEEKRDIVEEIKETLTSEFMQKDLDQDGFLTQEERGTAEVTLDERLV
jgi:Ca2+-binding EF-hand superfamily protein